MAKLSNRKSDSNLKIRKIMLWTQDVNRDSNFAEIHGYSEFSLYSFLFGKYSFVLSKNPKHKDELKPFTYIKQQVIDYAILFQAVILGLCFIQYYFIRTLALFLIIKSIDMHRPVRIQSKMNGMCLTQSQGEHNTRAGDLIVTTDFNGLKQKWTLVPDNQNFVVKNCLTGSVLDVQNGSNDIYKGIICYKQHGNQNQLWQVRNYKNNPHAYYIQNVKSGYVLEIEGGINVEGMRIVQNKMYGNLNQLWMISQI